MSERLIWLQHKIHTMLHTKNSYAQPMPTRFSSLIVADVIAARKCAASKSQTAIDHHGLQSCTDIDTATAIAIANETPIAMTLASTDRCSPRDQPSEQACRQPHRAWHRKNLTSQS
jgi:hypothetical protein